MGIKSATGAELVCSTLSQLGVEVVFGLPGTQTLSLFEALRRSALRTVLMGSESAATFAASGYFRSGGRLAAVSTIPGPGFTCALTGLAEARHDSAALLLLVVKPAIHESRRFQLQDIDLKGLAAPVVKDCFEIEAIEQIAPLLAEAVLTATSGEPGPVMVTLDKSMMVDSGPQAPEVSSPPAAAIDESAIDRVASRLANARRPLLFCGQGAAGAAAAIQSLAEQLTIPVVTTGSARGLLAEDHALSLPCDFSGGAWRELNELIANCDLVLALGCKFSHNGSAGFRLTFAPEKLIHVDASADVLGANYQADVLLESDTEVFLTRLRTAVNGFSTTTSAWTEDELGRWKERFASEMRSVLPHVPPLHGVPSADCSTLFGQLRPLLPRDSVLVTDSGYHQVLARTFWKSLTPRGLITPTDYQSMGFGLPASIGAAIACPQRRVVVVVGDGGIIMSGMELLTAVRENLPLTVLLLNDSGLGQIRMEQLRAYGHDFATRLLVPDMAAWCQAMGINYVPLQGELESALDEGLKAGGVILIEADITDSPELNKIRRRGIITSKAKRILGRTLLSRLKRLLGRG